MDSILTSIKKLLGITEEYENFDQDIIMHINSAFMIINKNKKKKKSGFSISDKSSTWDEFIPESSNLEAVKTYVHLKVKLMFDPPLSSTVIEAIKSQINELEWRLNVSVDPPIDE